MEQDKDIKYDSRTNKYYTEESLLVGLRNNAGTMQGGGGIGLMTLGGFSGLVTNPKMKSVLSKINYICLRHQYKNESAWHTVRGSGATDKPPCPSGKCTYGPSTWYNEAGLDLHFYPGPAEATYENTTLSQYGFKLVWHGTVEQSLSLPSSSFRPGDVSTQYYITTANKYSAHGCMFTGKDWRSDFVQRTIMANPKFIGRQGDYSVCIWRHPSFQEPGLSI